MIRSSKHRAAALMMASAAFVLGAGPAAAAAPIVDSSTVHVERPFIDCPDFSTLGVWDVNHRLTLFVDAEGTPIRDIEQVEFSGRIVNASTGAWVADSGARTYFDTLAPDGSFLTTYAVEVRHSDYIHGAGRTDFQTGDFNGLDGFDQANLDALCEALDG
jgi:ABC-type amino acid transport substrate-binding protein